MIDLVIKHLASQLNQHLKRTLGIVEDIVVVSSLAGPEGALAGDLSNKIVVFLTGIERDTVPSRSSDTSLRTMIGAAPLYLNLRIMVAANFTGANYPEGLKLISSAISYFQQQPVFDHHSNSDLDPSINKIILDIENLTFQEMSNVWGLLGGKYLPSVLYRARMVTLDGSDIQQRRPVVSAPAVAVEYAPDGVRR